jgi:hypothetical protein
MSKCIVTHINPDPDAITSVWLLRRFDHEWSEASVTFVAAGNTFKNEPVDSDPDIAHVDTGGGIFDHHNTNERTSAARLVFEHLQQKYDYLADDEALERLVEVVVADDHFDECCWPEALADRYNFMFGEILDGLKQNNTLSDTGLIDFGSTCLDGIYTSMKLKVGAEREIKQGREFETKWGKGLAIESKNDEVLTVGMKSGYVVVIRKDPEGMVRIKAIPKTEVDLSDAYEKVVKIDPGATWFLHASKKMLLNGSYKNPDHVFSKLSLDELVKLFNQ